MSKDFGEHASMRTTYPWGYLAYTWGLVAAGGFLIGMDWFGGLLGYVVLGWAVSVSADYGQERYRWNRYRHAVRRYERFVQENKEG